MRSPGVRYASGNLPGYRSLANFARPHHTRAGVAPAMDRGRRLAVLRMPSAPANMSNGDLVSEITANLSLLVKRQVDLAKTETEVELRRAKTLAELAGVAGGT